MSGKELPVKMTSGQDTSRDWPSLDEIVEKLAASGEITDAELARHRLDLGFPFWMVLEELPRDRQQRIISEATGIPLLEIELDHLIVDREASEKVGPNQLLDRRWLPLSDGRVAIANPYRELPDGDLAGRPLCLASSRGIDLMLEHTFPGGAEAVRSRRRLGRFLLDSGAVNEEGIIRALAEQRKNGGRLGEILIANNMVEPAAMTRALAARIGIDAVVDGATAVPLIPRVMAHELRAVAIETIPNRIQALNLDEPVIVAFTNPTPETLAIIESEVGRPINAQVTDDETLDALLAAVYAKEDVVDVVGNLAAQLPHLSALETKLSKGQLGMLAGVVIFALVCIAISPFDAAIFFASLGTLFYVLYTLYRMYSAWKGWRLGSTINPTPEELAELDGRELPSYTILLPAFREKPSTMRALFNAMANLDYPKHKLNGLLLLEADDGQTFDAIREIEASEPGLRPRWLKTLAIPPGEPRTKPKAMIYALLYSTGDLLTIFDAEDKPDPDQLKKAAWAFQKAGDNVACIQAKLSYYNSRQNLLTRWFTLEYAAWFDLFLPGLHAMKAPIPLGGTSNHFRLDLLKSVLSWDPYNVTEDADLGLRFTRAGYRTQMLESTTYEEANSRYKNWLRQRSRWIKGYMQTFLVHTRHPVQLYRELGFVNTLHFIATVGGLIYTVVISPIFWLLLVVWLVFEPLWIPALFPGPVYYMAMASLAFGNFFFVFLALIGAVGRGQDDLSPYTLLFPIYWLMMSIAAYFALYELVVKPHYWQKTEHGLNVNDAEEPGTTEQAGEEEVSRVA